MCPACWLSAQIWRLPRCSVLTAAAFSRGLANTSPFSGGALIRAWSCKLPDSACIAPCVGHWSGLSMMHTVPYALIATFRRSFRPVPAHHAVASPVRGSCRKWSVPTPVCTQPVWRTVWKSGAMVRCLAVCTVLRWAVRCLANPCLPVFRMLPRSHWRLWSVSVVNMALPGSIASRTPPIWHSWGLQKYPVMFFYGICSKRRMRLVLTGVLPHYTGTTFCLPEFVCLNPRAP